MLPVIMSVLIASNVFSHRLAENETDATDSGERVMEMQENRDEIRQEVQDRIQQAKDEMETKREEFRNRVAEIKDQRKQRVLTNLSDRFSTVNTNWTSHWANVLDRLSSILDKIASRSDDSSVQSAVADARSAISDAQDAVTAQAAKTYTLDFNSESTLGEDVSGDISSFHSDLRDIQESVAKARQAVKDAFEALRSLNTSTSTPEPTT